MKINNKKDFSEKLRRFLVSFDRRCGEEGYVTSPARRCIIRRKSYDRRRHMRQQAAKHANTTQY